VGDRYVFLRKYAVQRPHTRPPGSIRFVMTPDPKGIHDYAPTNEIFMQDCWISFLLSTRDHTCVVPLVGSALAFNIYANRMVDEQDLSWRLILREVKPVELSVYHILGEDT